MQPARMRELMYTGPDAPVPRAGTHAVGLDGDGSVVIDCAIAVRENPPASGPGPHGAPAERLVAVPRRDSQDKIAW